MESRRLGFRARAKGTSDRINTISRPVKFGARKSTASERRENNLTGCEDVYLKFKAMIWP